MNKIISRPIRRCRLCGSGLIKPVFSLGEQYVTCFPEPEDNHDIPKAPLAILFCESCLLPQLSHTVNPDVLYGEYWYRSSTNATMRTAMKDVVDQTLKRVTLNYGDTVLDIGANDGTLLTNYPPGTKLVGFEPSNIGDLAPSWVVIIRDFFSAFKYHLNDHPKVISSVAMFYDLDDPLRFLEDVALLLHRDGIFVNQLNYGPMILKNNAVDFLSAEHLTSWSLGMLTYAYEQCGLEIFDVAFYPLNGGTIRVYAQHQGGRRPVKPDVAVAIASERERQDDSPEAWRKFGTRVQKNLDRLMDLVSSETAKGKKVIIRGASTRGHVINQAAGLDRWIDTAGDRDPRKAGRMMGGTKIKIIPEVDLETLPHDYEVLFIYSYLSEIQGRSKPFLDRGGKFILPVPEVKLFP